MFERFTDRARAVVVQAQDEALNRKHGYIGTEHLLLGLLGQPDGIAAKALASLGVSADDVSTKIEQTVGIGDSTKKGHIPFTKRAKKVMELSLREALNMGHNYIGTEHLLLGVIREGEGVGALVLTELGVQLDQVRKTVQGLVDGGTADPVAARTPAAMEATTNAERLAAGAPIGSHHLLAALAAADGSMAAKVLAELGVDADAIVEKLSEMDADDTTDATPELAAAGKMSLRVDGDEAHVVLRDETTVGLAKTLTEHGDLTAKGALAPAFLPMWTAIRDALSKLAAGAAESDEEQSGGLLQRALRARLRRRKP